MLTQIIRMMERVVMRMTRVMMCVIVTKEAGSKINERDANNDKVKPAPACSDLECIDNFVDRTCTFK